MKMPEKNNKVAICSKNPKNEVYLAKFHKNIRIMEVNSDFLIGASGYKLYKLTNGKRVFFSNLIDAKYSFLSKFRLISRILRAEIRCYRTLSNNKGICVAKTGIFLENKVTGKFDKVFNILSGSRPMTLCEDREGNIFFGEYFKNKNRREVNVFVSFDRGENWKVAYTFLANTIGHIHGIHLDPYTGFLWITTGDENGECIIACTKDKFKTLEIIAKGDQEYRTCNLLFLENRIIYGTDSPNVENYIKAIDRTDISIQNLQKVQGSVINACQIGNICVISTTVEPSNINKDKFSYIWISGNGYEWSQIACFKKDMHNMHLFQFGNIRFPYYHNPDTKSLFFSGHALERIDGHSVELENVNDYFNVTKK